jgi:hypothetical protein
MNAPGLLVSWARQNHDTGSQQTVEPVSRLRPSGTPIMGDAAPAANGHRPHTWFVEPRHSSGART